MNHENLRRIFLLIACVCPLSCTNDVIAPKNLRDPVSIHIIDYGRHSALVIPSESGGLMKYAYGDWRWYALSDEGLWQGVAALLWPTQGALGRKKSATLKEAREELITLEVESEKVRDLYSRLEEDFQAKISSRVSNPLYDIEFVHSSKSYSLAHNSNSVVAQWLEDLGCEVRGARISSDWQVIESN